MRKIGNLFRRNNSSSTSAPNASTMSAPSAISSNPPTSALVSSSSPTLDTNPYTPIEDNIKKDLCTMIVLLQQVLELIETEPDPKVLKEQSLRLIDYIDRCCDLSKITYKKRFSGYG